MTEEITKTRTEQASADYLDEEGYLCCGKCRTRKQCRISFPLLNGTGQTEEKLVRIRCKCEIEAAKVETARQQELEHLDRVCRLKNNCFASPVRKKQTFEHADRIPEKVLKAAKAYVMNWDKVKVKNAGLLFWGECGTGKSYTAACIANALMEREVSVRMYSLADFTNAGYEEREEQCREVRKYDLVIFDDLGIERENEYGLETVFRVINARYESRKPTIFTTNLSLQALKEPSDLGHKRIYDRVQEMAVPLSFNGPDVRAAIQQEKLDLLKELCSEERDADQRSSETDDI